MFSLLVVTYLQTAQTDTHTQILEMLSHLKRDEYQVHIYFSTTLNHIHASFDVISMEKFYTRIKCRSHSHLTH